jgi:sterol desaturase/sphingolipid hydroxylase (fatty acid hydroxylase superfamily)
MRLGRFGYYCEFFLVPLFAVVLAAVTFAETPASAWLWALYAVAGIVTWTLVEYLMHRFVFHHVPLFRGMHAKHHEDHEALVGTPAWLSLPTMVVVAACLVGALGLEMGGGLTIGLALGYWWYISVHHILHHWQLPNRGYALRLKRRHALHHHIDEDANFGVTSGLWDAVFGTDGPIRRRSGMRSRAAS